MPTYQYACTECGEPLEVVQSFTDDALTECPSCGGRLKKLYGAVGIVFKGSGFYRTDSRGKPAASEPAASSGVASSNGSSDSGSASSSGGSGSDTGKSSATGGSAPSSSSSSSTSSGGSSAA